MTSGSMPQANFRMLAGPKRGCSSLNGIGLLAVQATVPFYTPEVGGFPPSA